MVLKKLGARVVELSTQFLEAMEAIWWKEEEEGRTHQKACEEKQQSQRVMWEGKRLGVAAAHT